MTTFNYKKNDSWGNIGWLGSDKYYAFWGKVLTEDLSEYFTQKVILDIGAGNGRIWEEAFKQGLDFKELRIH